MKYALNVTVNHKTTERQVCRACKDAGMVGIDLSDIIEKYPRATSFNITVVLRKD